MKLSFFTIAAALLLQVFGCSSPVIQKKKQVIPKVQTKQEDQKADKLILHDETQAAIMDTVLIGDLNNDRMNDTVFIYTPPTIASVDQQGKIHFWNNCVNGDCYNRIRFSAQLPELKFEMSVWGTLQNAGDLDNDGFAELLFNPGWFQSNWTHLCLYSLKNNKWKKIADVTARRDQITGTMKKNLILRDNNYYLKGTQFIDGDDKSYLVKIPLEILSDSVSNETLDTVQKR